MKLSKTIYIYFLLFLMMGQVYAQKTEVIPSNIALTKNRLDAEAVFISNEKGVCESPVFKHGEKISINFREIKGLNIIDNKYFPEIYLTLVSKTGDTIYSTPKRNDYDIAVEGRTDNSLVVPLLQNYSLLLWNGVASGEEYTMTCTIIDSNGGGSMSMKMRFKVVANPNHLLSVNKKGLDYAEVFLYSSANRDKLIDNKIPKDDYLTLTFTDVVGYGSENDNADFKIEYTIVDKLGVNIVESELFLRSKCENGKLIETAIDMRFNLFEIKEINSGETYTLNVKFLDMYSDGFLAVSTQLFLLEE